MSSQLEMQPVSFASPDFGRLGSRRLVLVQLVDIARLQSEVLPLPIDGGLIAVTGRGPKDSNGSGKTSWEAAVDLLGMSHAWQPRSPHIARHAVGLVLGPTDGAFKAHRAAQGFILGGFQAADKGRTQPLTVIARIDRASEQLRFRILDGLQFADGETHLERIEDAARLWEQAPKTPTYSAQAYLKEFLGGHSRSTGYLNTRGNLRSTGSSMFSSALTSLRPDDIAIDLLQMSGLVPLLEEERQRRAEAHGATGELDRARKQLAEYEVSAEKVLAEIAARRDALAAVEQAETARKLWLAGRTAEVAKRIAELTAEREARSASAEARELRDQLAAQRDEIARLEDDAGLQAALARTHDTLEELRRPWDEVNAVLAEARTDYGVTERALNKEGLQDRASRWTGRSLAVIRSDLADAKSRVDDLRESVGIARQHRKDAAKDLAAAEVGDTTEAVALLRAAGVHAVALGDAVEVTDEARKRLDPALSAWADAVVVAPPDRDRAVRTLADLPGTVLLAGEANALPEGVVAAPDGAASFLLALDTYTTSTPEGVVIGGLPHEVIGGFGHPQIGRQARVDQARSRLERADEALTLAADALGAAESRQRGLAEDLDAAEAAERVSSLTSQLNRERVARDAAEKTVDRMRPEWQEAERAHTRATEDLEDRTQRLATRKEEHLRTSQLWVKTVDEPDHASRQQARALDIDARLRMVARWTDAPLPSALDLEAPTPEDLARIDDAVQGLFEELATEGEAELSLSTWRRRANSRLEAGLRSVGIEAVDEHVEATADVPPRVVELARERLTLLDRSPDPVELPEVPSNGDDLPGSAHTKNFFTLVDALGDWLEPLALQDEAVEASTQRQLTVRRDNVDAAENAFNAQVSSAESNREGVIDLVEGRLEAIASAFRARVEVAEGRAADLLIERVEVDAGSTLRWRVTPRWARHAGDPPASYAEGNPNLAQEKLHTIHLILAAIVDGGPPGKVLVFDELAAGLGSSNFPDAVAALADAARKERITVLVTLQDTNYHAVTSHVDGVLFFRLRSNEQLLNDPTVVFQRGPDAALEVAEPIVVAGRERAWIPAVTDAAAWDASTPLVPDDLGGWPDDDPAAPGDAARFDW
jgi:hypothetical protein